MKRSFFTISILLASYVVAMSQVFWTEDFADGIPNEWTNIDASGIGILWSYCPDTISYGNPNNPACPFEFSGWKNGNQVKFQSDSPENGFATCSLGALYALAAQTSFQSSLTTDVISCAGQEKVYLSFNSHIGVWRKDAASNAVVNISKDGNIWETFYPHPNLFSSINNTAVGSKRWSYNPEKVVFDISTIAANQDSIFIQWSWCGNDEYHWSIDDIVLSAENPLPNIDLTLRPTSNFHAIMPNFETPESQIDTAFFLTDIANAGALTQFNFDVIARVTDQTGNQVLYEGRISIDSLTPGQAIENIIFPPYFHTAGVGEYKILYTTSSTLEDAYPDNNNPEYSFLVSESRFSKNKPTEQTMPLYPTNFNQNNQIETNWGIANYFYVPKGNGFYLDEVIFEIPNRSEANDNGDIYIINDPNIRATVKMYAWNDINNIDQASPDEYTLIGFTDFTISGGDGNEPNKIKLENTISNELNIPLNDDQAYILAMEYTATTQAFRKLFAIKESTALNYDPMILANSLNGRNRFAAMNKVGPTETYNTFAFGGDVIPHIGFTISKESGVSASSLYVENGLNIYPNPVNKNATIEILLQDKSNAVLEVSTLDGKVIRQYEVAKDQTTITIDCKSLPNGTYMLAFKSDTAIALERLVVLH